MTSGFRGVIEFFADLGIYDVILPFLLVFTLTYAILEKTMILGYVEISKVKYGKKNLNSMVAFVIGFLVVASSRLVAIINQSLAQTMVLLTVGFAFMLTIGIFAKSGELTLENKEMRPWFIGFAVAMLIGVALIYLNAAGWLEYIYAWVLEVSGTSWFSALIAIIFIAFMIMWITKPMEDPSKSQSK